MTAWELDEEVAELASSRDMHKLKVWFVDCLEMSRNRMIASEKILVDNCISVKRRVFTSRLLL